MRRKDEWVVLKHTSDRVKKLENTTAKRKQELAEKGHTLVRMVRMRFADEEQGNAADKPEGRGYGRDTKAVQQTVED